MNLEAKQSDNVDGGAGGLPLLQFTNDLLNAIKAQCDAYQKNKSKYVFGVGSFGGSFGFGFSFASGSSGSFGGWLTEVCVSTGDGSDRECHDELLPF